MYIMPGDFATKGSADDEIQSIHSFTQQLADKLQTCVRSLRHMVCSQENRHADFTVLKCASRSLRSLSADQYLGYVVLHTFNYLTCLCSHFKCTALQWKRHGHCHDMHSWQCYHMVFLCNGIVGKKHQQSVLRNHVTTVKLLFITLVSFHMFI